MNEQYILKEVSDVTEIAKNIFGDIVHKVYYAYWLNETVPEEYTISIIDRAIKASFHNENSIDQDGKTIIIEFFNGNHVIFSNSEWGSMEKFNISEIKKYV